ncbi:MAG TPA: hypothetical protein VM327_09535, partial [Candidatus Thermoplasmatota archaeon]|nr:hypothetical protein [Candidatus Thermoplasmatota archaeon]
GDIVLSGSNAGTVVSGSTAGLNNAVATVFGGMAAASTFFDADNNGAFSLNDAVYIDGPAVAASLADGFVTAGDVQLSGATPTGGFGGGGSSGTGSVSNTGTNGTVSGSISSSTSGSVSSSASMSSSGGVITGSNSGSQSDNKDDNSTPGFELVALVGALAVALILVRRKL